MKFATYIDGSESTPYGVMLTRHSVSCSVSIAKEHRDQWQRHLENFLEVEEEWALPTDRAAPVPITFSTDAMADIVSDLTCENYAWADPYLAELTYMCTEDSSGMGVVYVMGSKT